MDPTEDLFDSPATPPRAARPGYVPAAAEPNGDPHTDAPADLTSVGADPIEATGLRRLDPNWLRAERISGWIFSGVLIPAGLVFVVLGITVWSASDLWRLLLPLIWVVGTAILVWSTHWLPAMSYRAAGYIVTPRDIEIRRGILWKTVTTIPRSRVQHTDVSRGPLMRRFGIAKLIIHTAGTQHATVELPGLARAEAERIRDHLVDRVGRAGHGARADGPAAPVDAPHSSRDASGPESGAEGGADVRSGARDDR